MIVLALALMQVPEPARLFREDMTKSARAVFGPDAPVATLAGQIHQESGWRLDAKSWVGAQGLAQFMPGTAADMADRHPQECKPANPYNPAWAFRCRDRYLRTLLQASTRPMAFQVTSCSAWAFALRAYNGGLGWINRDRRRAGSMGLDPDDWKEVEPVNAGRSAAAHRENREYPVRIYRLSARYEDAGWGRVVEC